MGKNGKKDAKGQRAKKAAAKNAGVSDLSANDAASVKGGQTKQTYLEYKLSNANISNYSISS